MKKITLLPAMLIAAAALFACSSTPKSVPALDIARSDYSAAQSNANVVNMASVELKAAGEALNQANDALANQEPTEKVEKLAYIARQKIATAVEVAKQKAAEKDVAEAAKERDRIRLAQRTNEADQAKSAANAAQAQTAIAQSQTADAQRKAQEAEARARQLEAQLNDLAAKKTERGMIITLGDVLFNTDKADLRADGMRTVQKLADILNQNPQRAVLIEGFTDSTGTSAHNQQLSERRADSVRAALLSMGIARDRINTRGYGENYPVAANDSASNRQLNRRVEIVLSDETGVIKAR